MQLHETTKVEEVEARRCKARLEHLVSIGLPEKDEATKWNDKRMDRILADYMLRRGYHRSATQLARERQIEVIPPAGHLMHLIQSRAIALSVTRTRFFACCGSHCPKARRVCSGASPCLNANVSCSYERLPCRPAICQIDASHGAADLRIKA